ncbi:hypothetical protein E1265_00980 [Streptomyces sp. 8K308]|uniref:hypothetical protein n=1 Tax=Streptomyces sp. 8K308 TaxID=2530388 RepID=UPI001053F8A0|nr:hypothetical protein [Streptomyces sp. 8K308]TDC27713.1 hypothetical protein E1265_00980 [Streptomyces sp. 8K308]
MRRVQRSTDDIRTTLAALATSVHLGFDRMAASLNQARQELGERIDAVEAEIRSLRLTAQTSAAGEEIRRDIGTLHTLIEGWRAEAAAVRAEAETTRRALESAVRGPAGGGRGGPAEAADGEPDRHSSLLLASAGIASVTLTCHRDLWAFLIEKAGHERHFRVPGEVRDAERGSVRVTLSGRTLIAAFTALGEIRDADAPAGDRALAHELYEAFADVVAAAAAGPRMADGGEVAVVIDRSPREDTPGGDPVMG